VANRSRHGLRVKAREAFAKRRAADLNPRCLLLGTELREYAKMFTQISKRFWRDECGVVYSTDLILVTALLGLGVIVGLVCLRNQVVQEFCDVGDAVGALNQSYEYEGRTDAQQRDYFLDNFPAEFPDAASLNWLGNHSVAGSDYTDQDNANETLEFPAPTPENTTPGED
jgi:hypothetical protein